MVWQPSLFEVKVLAAPEADAVVRAVAEEITAADPTGAWIARVLRRTYDMLLDGQHTGRYRWDQLYKTEKTHFGTLVEINLQREFGFADGNAMDFAISGIDVDCKYSQDRAEWMIPPEAVGQVILGLWASDDEGRWSLGLVRADEHLLTASQALALPEPGLGESVSVRLARRRPAHHELPFVSLDGAHWVVARPDDPVETAPLLPAITE